jgi:beta-lactamase family protein
LALLVDERRLDWKKPVRDYIPELRMRDVVATDRMTVPDLLCHHSGPPRHDWVHLPADLSPEQMLAGMPYLEPSDDIRSTFQYQNLGYLVRHGGRTRKRSELDRNYPREAHRQTAHECGIHGGGLSRTHDAAVPYAMDGDPPAREAVADQHSGRRRHQGCLQQFMTVLRQRMAEDMQVHNLIGRAADLPRSPYPSWVRTVDPAIVYERRLNLIHESAWLSNARLVGNSASNMRKMLYFRAIGV